MVQPASKRLLTEANANASFVPLWKANTAYVAGQAVVNPSGDVVSAKVNFTSGASYSASKWNLSASFIANTSLAAEEIRTVDATAMRPWRAALAARDYAPARVLFVGDSRTEGEGATTVARRWQDRVAK